MSCCGHADSAVKALCNPDMEWFAQGPQLQGATTTRLPLESGNALPVSAANEKMLFVVPAATEVMDKTTNARPTEVWNICVWMQAATVSAVRCAHIQK